MTSVEQIAFLDIGNTSIKILCKDKIEIFDIDENVFIQLRSYLNENLIQELVYSSSNPSILLTQIDLKSTDVNAILDKSQIDFTEISGMGTDRKLGLIGARSLADGNLITIDLGTALTINFLSKDNKCLGGFIIPGYDTQLRSLNQFTSSLPHVRIDSNDTDIGKNTEDAISKGVRGSIIGSIKELASDRFPNEKPKIFITGGRASLFLDPLKAWNNSVTLRDDLVLKGLKSLYLGIKND